MIRFADENDINRIMVFIDRFWSKGHIMGRDRRLFDFQHKWGNEISFVVSEDDGRINGILGYIPYDKKRRDITLAIWKALKTEDPMLGIKILSFLRENGDVRSISAPGINPRTRAAYEFMGLHTGQMRQWYRLADRTEYRIACVKSKEIPAGGILERGMHIRKLNGISDILEFFGSCEFLDRDRQLYKSPAFLERRYFRHPSFEYLCYGIKSGDKNLLVIFRIQECRESRALRLIDCLGDHELIGACTALTDKLLDQFECEYADFYETGVDEKILRNGGWLLRPETDNIIPEYFSPFEQRNIEIFYMSQIKDVILFKGDGDMDRPN